MPVYLVVIDETPEAQVALRFAAQRAQRTDGSVHIVAVIARQPFVAFGGVQATIEAEAHERAEALVATAAGSLASGGGTAPLISVRHGDGESVIREYLAEHPEISALVLGAAAEGGPGPLVTHFSAAAGTLPCPLYVIPGNMSDEVMDQLG